MTAAQLVIPDLPLHIGPTPGPTNPNGIPATFPFAMRFDPVRQILVEVPSPSLDDILRDSYALGLELGTPLADDSLGLPYVDDFVGFITANTERPGRALEIGAGVGFTSKRLIEEGWRLDILEPGRGYEAHWRRYGLTVINDYFPSAQAQGPYDLITCYAVLEHIAEPDGFLADIRAHLAPGGRFIMAVPDCEDEIQAGDPGILIHEHFNYFDRASIAHLLERAGFIAQVQKSAFGRSIYAVAVAGRGARRGLDPQHLALLASYPDRCAAIIAQARGFISELATKGSVGVYCPGRCLAVVPGDLDVRLFDDSRVWQQRHVPPFRSAVESRQSLLERPVDYLLIMSRTFGERLKKELAPALPHTQIFTNQQVLGEADKARDFA